MKILGLDPGETTGYALVDSDVGWEEGGSFGFGDWATLECVIDEADVVVVESFRLYANKAGAQIGSEFIPAQVIGVIRYLALKSGTPLFFQPAHMIHSRTRTLSPYARRLVDPVLPVGVDRHARDALAHALVWARSGKRG